jgi:5-methylcytosine-specific restriction endonuclease McrA
MKKTCTVCKKQKPLDAFGPRFRIPHARASCRECDADYQRKYHRRNLEKCRRQARERAARDRILPERRAKVLANQKKCWQNGGRERQQAYLDKLKAADFFKWKARKSYIWLTSSQLKQLWDSQGGRCALTGRKLDTSAELDHIVPRTRGGGDTLDNAQWLCSDANQSKRKMLDAEFVAFCREVVAWADR